MNESGSYASKGAYRHTHLDFRLHRQSNYAVETRQNVCPNFLLYQTVIIEYHFSLVWAGPALRSQEIAKDNPPGP
jgi:hypothetical protein